MATARAPQTPPAAGPAAAPALRVTSRSPRGTIWRAGREWAPQPTTIAVSELKAEQIKALRAEPLLVVEDVTLGAGADGDVATA